MPACGESQRDPVPGSNDPSDPTAKRIFQSPKGSQVDSFNLYGLWEAELGKKNNVKYTGRILIERNHVTIAVKCSFQASNGKVEEELYAVSESEAIITRQQIYIENHRKQTIQKSLYFCSAESKLAHANYLMDIHNKRLILESLDGRLKFYKISELSSTN